jgi:hypothetical protein
MSHQNNTPPHPEGKLMFQMQAMMQMMERMNFVMGNVCDRQGMEKRGNEAGTSAQNGRKLGLNKKETMAVGLIRSKKGHSDFDAKMCNYPVLRQHS